MEWLVDPEWAKLRRKAQALRISAGFGGLFGLQLMDA
jgi:hypothetical protein